MHPSFDIDFKEDSDGNPGGGTVRSEGLCVAFQHGPIKEYGRNGVVIETLIEVVIKRLQFFQTVKDGKFACRENALAITKLQEALHWLDHRTAERQMRGVEGTNEP